MLIFALMKSRVLATLLAAAFLAIACNGPLPVKEPSQEKYSRVLIYVGEGVNTLNSYIKADISEIIGEPSNSLLPAEGSNKAFIIISHLPNTSGDYRTPTSPTITRVSRDYLGRPICDTLLRMPAGTILTKSENMRSALEFVKSSFPSDSYGMIMSSHGTGWLPAGYLLQDSGASTLANRPKAPEGAVRYVERPDPSGIVTKTFGQELAYSGGELWSYEMSLQTLASAIPFKFDYIIFDACLMGGIETAYELRNVTRYLCVSPAEILGDGFPYNSILGRLLVDTPVNVKGACEDYFNMYEQKTGVYQSATISMIDCSRLDGLATCCKDLFSKYRESIATVDKNNVQGFNRKDIHWMFDLKDIMAKAGMSYEDQASLKAAIDDCIVYKAHTKSFLGEFDINEYCGMSMYLPNSGNSLLNSYYTELEWNKATGLVE